MKNIDVLDIKLFMNDLIINSFLKIKKKNLQQFTINKQLTNKVHQPLKKDNFLIYTFKFITIIITTLISVLTKYTNKILCRKIKQKTVCSFLINYIYNKKKSYAKYKNNILTQVAGVL